MGKGKHLPCKTCQQLAEKMENERVECKNCANLAEDHSHPITDGKSISALRGYVCLAPEFYEKNGMKIVFSGWKLTGCCECYEKRNRGL